MKATIEQRYEAAGYVYTEKTRMGFSPKFTVTRNPEDMPLTDIVIWQAINDPEPTRGDIEKIRNALANKFPDRNIFADTSGGLTKIYEAV